MGSKKRAGHCDFRNATHGVWRGKGIIGEKRKEVRGVAGEGPVSVSSRNDIRVGRRSTQKGNSLKRKLRRKRAGSAFRFETRGIFDKAVLLEWGKAE